MAESRKKMILPRHKVVLKKISADVRQGMTMEQAMLEAGYSPSYARASTRLKETDAWNRLLEKYLPDEKLAKKVDGLINHKEWRATDAGLTHAFKLKSKYAPEEHKHEITERRTLDEIDEEISKTISEIAGTV